MFRNNGNIILYTHFFNFPVVLNYRNALRRTEAFCTYRPADRQISLYCWCCCCCCCCVCVFVYTVWMYVVYVLMVLSIHRWKNAEGAEQRGGAGKNRSYIK